MNSVYLNIFEEAFRFVNRSIFKREIYLQLECCGVDSATDFAGIGASIPGSCCGKDAKKSCPLPDAYKQGCVSALEDFVRSALTVLGGVAIGIAAAEVRNAN